MIKKITLSISGMSCQGCADSLDRLFGQESGIANAAVSFEKCIAELEFDPIIVTEGRLCEIVTKAGFSVRSS